MCSFLNTNLSSPRLGCRVTQLAFRVLSSTVILEKKGHKRKQPLKKKNKQNKRKIQKAADNECVWVTACLSLCVPVLALWPLAVSNMSACEHILMGHRGSRSRDPLFYINTSTLFSRVWETKGSVMHDGKQLISPKCVLFLCNCIQALLVAQSIRRKQAQLSAHLKHTTLFD